MRVFAFLAAFLFAAPAFAQTAPTVPADDPLKLVEQIVSAAQAKNWLLLVPVVVILAIYLVRKFLGPKIPFLQTDRGGALMALIGAVATAVIGAAALPGPHTFIAVAVAAVSILLANKSLFLWLNKLLSPTGADAAQQVAATAAVTTAQAAQSGPAAAVAINQAMTDLKK